MNTNSAKSVLRVITAGSVDDGKSTLIGRLLFDSKAILSDQLEAMGRSRLQRTSDGSVDLSLLTDGLEAEREQGITIDVAYRYFNTARRKFILADAPGHEQYTRNMVTGASTADAVIVLIDATRVPDGALLPQTKRHSAIAKLLGISHLIVAVNKMDLVGFDEAMFGQIANAYQQLAAQLQLPVAQIVPISALNGENVTRASERMPWYCGKHLLEILESLEDAPTRNNVGFRFPVQWVIRSDGASAAPFRGFAGRVAAGRVRVGDAVRVAGQSYVSAKVAQILIGERAIEEAQIGQSITLTLDREVDISRGDTLILDSDTLETRNTFDADVCWLDTQAFNPQRSYWLKHGTRTTQANITRIESVLDVSTLNHADNAETANALTLNAIGRVTIKTKNPLAADTFARSKATGGFVLIDTATHQTAAAGMIR
jgi:sulfate adenylyltransferase subunit 1